MRSISPTGLLASALALLSGCSSDSGTTGPTPPPPSTQELCGGSTPVSLAVLQATTFDCSNGATTISLAGAGATYLVVPQFPTNQAPNQPVSYTLSAGSGALASTARVETSAPASRPLAFSARNTVGPGAIQQRFDQARRAADRRDAQRWHAAAPAVALLSQAPVLGSLQQFHVLAVADTATPTTQRVTASLDYIGQNILLYVDTLSPTHFTSDQITQLGQLFDGTLYPIDLAAFGAPSDIDANGHVIMLLSPVVNGLTPASQCSQGYIAGFFDGFDLVASDTSSNQGEVFYGIVPDPNGTVSCAHSLDNVLADVPGTFLHELQHLINFGQHVLVHHSVPEEGWLDEGMSLVAQELGSLHYEAKFPPPTGRTNPNQIFPDSSEGYIATQLLASYDYLTEPDTATLTLHSDADGGLDWRAGDWLLLRWLGDQKGTGLYKMLEETSATGTDNIAAAAGEPFASLFGDFSLSLYTDSIPGVPKSAIPQRDRFTTRTFREIYAAIFGNFPIAPAVLSGSVNASAVPGTPTFYQVNTAGSASQVEIDFTAPGGAALLVSLHPQVSVFRLQ